MTAVFTRRPRLFILLSLAEALKLPLRLLFLFEPPTPIPHPAPLFLAGFGTWRVRITSSPALTPPANYAGRSCPGNIYPTALSLLRSHQCKALVTLRPCPLHTCLEANFKVSGNSSDPSQLQELSSNSTRWHPLMLTQNFIST